MKRTTKAATLGLATAAVLAVGGGVASAATSHSTHTKGTKKTTTVQQDKDRYDAFVKRLDTRLDAFTTKVDASTTLSADQKATLKADAATAKNDAAAVKAKVDAATTKDQIKAAHQGHPVKADLTKLRADAKADGVTVGGGHRAKGAKASASAGA